VAKKVTADIFVNATDGNQFHQLQIVHKNITADIINNFKKKFLCRKKFRFFKKIKKINFKKNFAENFQYQKKI